MHSTSFDNHAIAKLSDNKQLGREIRNFLQTDKYIRLKSDAAASDTLKRILRDRADENRQSKKRLVTMLDELVSGADYYALMKKQDVKADRTAAAINEVLDYLSLNIFSKFGFLTTPHENPQRKLNRFYLPMISAKNS